MNSARETPVHVRLGSRDYARADIDDLGNVVVEFNAWDYSLGRQLVTVLSFRPSEAQLLSDMLLRQADHATRQAGLNNHFFLPY